MSIQNRMTVVLSVALLAICVPVTAQPEANKALIRDRWLPMMQTADQAIADEIFAPGFTCHAPHYPQAGTLAGYRVEVISAGAIVGDWQVVLEDLIAEGDTVVGRFTAGGKMPPAGVPYTNTWIIFFRFEEGKIAEEWWQYDLLGVQEQLGAIPATRTSYTWGEASTVTGDPGDPSTNKTIVERSEEIWNTGDVALAEEVFAADFVNHDPGLPDVGDLESLKGFILLTRTAFPDFHVETDDMIAEGDTVAVRRTVTATHQTDFMGITATGRKIQWTGMTTYRIADGKIVESWWSYDALGIMQQLTAEEWPIEGPWITSLPTPMGNMLVKGTWIAQDEAKTRFTGEFDQINVYPLLTDLYPDMEAVKFAGALATKTIVNEYQMTALEYFISRPGPGHEEIVGIAIVSGTVRLTGPDQALGMGTGAYYMAAQDADQDGFPDDGEQPVLCYPWQWSARRLTAMPPCTPTPMPEGQ